jgi:PAS domain S-box-containing protein
MDTFETKTKKVNFGPNLSNLQLIYDSISDVIFFIAIEPNNNFRFTLANPSFFKVTGLREDQVVGKLVQDVIPQPSLQIVLANYQKAINEKSKVIWEETSTYPAGIKTGEVSVTPVFDETGKCINLIGTVHDMTERKKYDEDLKKKNEELERINNLFIGRELKMKELKEKIKVLEENLKNKDAS